MRIWPMIHGLARSPTAPPARRRGLSPKRTSFPSCLRQKQAKVEEMDSRASAVLEFNRVKEMVAEFAACDLGGEFIRNEEPTAMPELVRGQYELVKEMMDAVSWRQTLPMEGVDDVRGSLHAARPSGTYLDPWQLLRVDRLLKVGAGLKRFFHTFRDDFPKLHRLTDSFDQVTEFQAAVAKAITRDGEIHDDATPELARIRVEMRSLSHKIENVFDRMLRSPETRQFLQETYVTERKGRKVLPVKSDFRSHVSGIVHDVSISGGTVFIEPMAVVGLSNELTELTAQEEEEIRRILLSLTEHLRRHLEAVLADVEIVAQLDMLYGKARFAERYKCTIPGISNDGSLTIEDGRHPLLLKSHENKCVPLNVSLRSSDSVLVISGPNAGGKTTAAKTVAVLCLMTQTSTPIPAGPNTVLPLFFAFFADIGDYQDISRGVSTFTSHVGEVKRILDNVRPGSLVVLDELGTATDPVEGAVLAEAILEELTERAARTVVTSHLPSLKSLHLTRNWARSASMGLDPETEKPNFVLSMDVPGESSGLTIARQLGIPENVIARAYSLMSNQQRDFTHALEAVTREKGKVQKTSRELQQERREVEEERSRYEESLQALDAEKAKLKLEKLKFRQDVLSEKKKLLREAKSRIEKMIARLPSRKELARSRKVLEEEAHAVEEESQQTAEAIEKVVSAPRRDLPLEEIREGMVVYARNLRQAGTVKTVYPARKKVDLVVDGVVFNLDADQLAEHLGEETRPPSPPGRTSIPRKDFSATELNLIGERVGKAIALLDRFINDASLSRVELVRIIHGYGTGALRKGVREFLAGHPLVDGFRSEDEAEPQGGAVTIVRLK